MNICIKKSTLLWTLLLQDTIWHEAISIKLKKPEWTMLNAVVMRAKGESFHSIFELYESFNRFSRTW